MWAIEDGVEAADQHGMGETLEGLGLVAQLPQRLGFHLIGPDDLGHHDREQVVVPDEHDLEAPATPEHPQDGTPGGDLVALLEVPGGGSSSSGGRVGGHDGLHHAEISNP